MDKIELIFQNAYSLAKLMDEQEAYFEKFKKEFASSFDNTIVKAIDNCIEESKNQKDKLNKAYRNALWGVDKLHKCIVECHKDFAPKYEELKNLFNND